MEMVLEKVTVINRTFEKARVLATRFAGEAKTLAELEKTLIEADILISSTGAKDFVITKAMMEKVEKTAQEESHYLWSILPFRVT